MLNRKELIKLAQQSAALAREAFENDKSESSPHIVGAIAGALFAKAIGNEHHSNIPKALEEKD